MLFAEFRLSNRVILFSHRELEPGNSFECLPSGNSGRSTLDVRIRKMTR